MNRLEISEIWIYPVKSLGGIPLTSAKVMRKGIIYDRRWMLIDADKKGMTQRVYPQMALFKLSFDVNGFRIEFGSDSALLPFQPAGPVFRARVWNDEITVTEVSPQLSEWFSKRLNVSCQLVYFPEHETRVVDKNYTINEQQVSLADAYPLLVIGQQSLDDLNSRMKSPLPMNRFRPNIVFTGGRAYEEDEWHNFRAGHVLFSAVKPCARCVLTTVDQTTGLKGAEPLVTLASFRKRGNNIYFGQNLIVLKEGEINIGDGIELEQDNYF